jgi:hypothetical protein
MFLPFASLVVMEESIMLCINSILSRVTIHLRVHNHPIANGKCREFLEETKRLIAKEVDCTPNKKMFAISLSASKT